MRKGDYFLLCSDGLPDMVEDEDIHLTINTFNTDLNTIGEQLIKLTNDNGGRDNVSIILCVSSSRFRRTQACSASFVNLFGQSG